MTLPSPSALRRFLNGSDEAVSTEPLKNENEDLALGFYYMKNVRSVCVCGTVACTLSCDNG